MNAPRRRSDPLAGLLALIERGGNALPNPATLFLVFALAIIVISDLAARSGLSALHPGDGSVVRPVSLLTIQGLHQILTQMVKNFTGFAPLGTVLVALLGIGIAEAQRADRRGDAPARPVRAAAAAHAGRSCSPA